MISESRAGSSKKSKSRYDLLPRSRAPAQTSHFRGGMFEGQRKGGRKGRKRYVGHLELSDSQWNFFRFHMVYINVLAPFEVWTPQWLLFFNQRCRFKAVVVGRLQPVGVNLANQPVFHDHKLRMIFAFLNSWGEEFKRVVHDVWKVHAVQISMFRQIKFHWNTDTPIRLGTVCGCWSCFAGRGE